MHHCREQALQVDTFGQAVGGDQDALLGVTQFGDSGFALARGKFTGYGLDRGILELAPQEIGQVVGRGDVAAEHHRLEAFFDQALQMLVELGELGVVGGAGQVVGGSNQVLQAGGVFGLCRRLNVVGGEGIVQTVHDAFAGLGFQLLQ